MFKSIVIVAISLFVAASASAQEGTCSSNRRLQGGSLPPATEQTQKFSLSNFIELWKNVAHEVERQDREFGASVDETKTTILARKNEIRKTLFEAGRELKLRNIPMFISLMNQAEIKISSLHSEFGMSTPNENLAYDRLLEIASGTYKEVKPESKMIATSWVPESL